MSCFQITPLVSHIVVGAPSTTDGKLMWLIPEEAHEPLDKIISPYNQSAHFYLDQVNMGRPPAAWVYIILPREYRIAQHIWDIRSSREALAFSMHRTNPPLPLPDGFVPTVGCIVTYNKNDLFIHSARSPLLNEVWKELANKEENSHWLCIVENEDALRELDLLEMAIAS
jgi:hypothetical protein